MDKVQLKEKLIKDIKDILNSLGDGEISPSAYDTAWVARIPSKEDVLKPMFPECLKWVEDNQLPDGSWGESSIEYYHDRIICTLSCIVALKSWNRSSEKINHGEIYISNNIQNLKRDLRDTVGFELIFPSLISQAKRLDLDIPYDSEEVVRYVKLKEQKLSRLPIETLYKFKSSLSHSLEFLFGMILDFERMKIHQEENGAYGASPSSTAFMLMNIYDDKAQLYIRGLLDKFNYIPVLHPLDIWERTWVINSLIDNNIQSYFDSELKLHIAYLDSKWSQQGVGFSTAFNVPDLDITASIFRILNKFKIKKNPEVFSNFETESGFYCYVGEMDSSPTHLSNLLRALLELDYDYSFKKLQEDKALNFLLKNIDQNYTCKWNISPYYTIDKLILYKFSGYNELKSRIISFILTTQNTDGGWGFLKKSTLVETAYALSALVKNSNDISFEISDYFNKGLKYLEDNHNSYEQFTKSIWIGKCLYSPINIDKIDTYAVLLNLINKQYD